MLAHQASIGKDGGMARTLTDEIREAVDACGVSRYRLCKELGFAQSTLSRFMSGKAGLSLDTLDRLARRLGLHLAATRRPAKRPK
jgi:transcriptional regulator with XRE-family HTH domain